MKKLFAALTLCLLFPAAQASAVPVLIGQSQTWNFTNTPNCATCSAVATFTLTSSTSLQIDFVNTSTDGVLGQNILTAIGLNTTPDVVTGLSILSQNIEGGKVWKLDNGVGNGNWELGVGTVNGINDGLDNQSNAADSGRLTLGWTAPTVTLGLNIDATTAKFQNSTFNGQSVHANGVCCITPPSGDDDGGPQSVPEPASLLLFGLGTLVTARRLKR